MVYSTLGQGYAYRVMMGYGKRPAYLFYCSGLAVLGVFNRFFRLGQTNIGQKVHECSEHPACGTDCSGEN